MPARHEIREQIRKLNRLDPRGTPYEAIKRTYDRITEGFSFVVGTTASHELFFRVRKMDARPLSATDFLAPPPHLVTGYQRCNPPGVPMFYAASRRIGALVESRVEEGEVVYLSQWIGKQGLPVNRIFLDDVDSQVHGVDASTMEGPNDDLVLSHIDTMFTKRIHSTFADDYKFTAAIAEHLTRRFPLDDKQDIRADGYVALQYPSVLAGLTRNTAMHAPFARERLDLLHVMELRILRVEDEDIAVEVLDNALPVEGDNLRWVGRPNYVPARRSSRNGVLFIKKDNRLDILTDENQLTNEGLAALMNES